MIQPLQMAKIQFLIGLFWPIWPNLAICGQNLIYIFCIFQKMDECCVICKESSPETIIVSTDKGRRTLVPSSLERQDGLHKALELPYYPQRGNLSALKKMMKHQTCDQVYLVSLTLKTIV